MPCRVIGAPALGLKLEENGHPALFGRELEQERSILINAIVPLELGEIALVHVNVVDAIQRGKTEDFIGAVDVGAPGFAVGIDPGVAIALCQLHVVVNLLVQIVVGTRPTVGQTLHFFRLEQMAAAVVEGQTVGARLESLEAGVKAR